MIFLSNNVEEKILHGTTTVGIKASDGVVLCADMRASAGYFIANNNTMKIQKLDDHAGLTLAGGVADAQNITDTLRYHAGLHRIQKQEPISIRALARLTSLMFHQSHRWISPFSRQENSDSIVMTCPARHWNYRKSAPKAASKRMR